LDKTLSIIHQGSLIRLHPVDLNANAVSRRGLLPLDTETTRSPLPKTSAEIEFDRKTQSIVDTDGGFSCSDKE